MKIWGLLKQKSVYVTLGLALLLSVLCMIKIAMPNKQYHYAGEYVFERGNIRTESVISDAIVLTPGVYEVELEYTSDTSLKNFCNVTDGTVFYGGLLSSGECLYKNLKQTNFKIWLFENTEALLIQVSYSGDGYLETGNLVICETDALWTMLLTVVWSIAIFVIAILMFKRYDSLVGVSIEKKTVILGLGVIIFIVSLPYLYGGGIGGADGGYHLLRIEGVKDALLSGQFPVRLEPEWLYGYGYANAIFYCNTLLYFPAILRLLGFPVYASYNLYCIALNVATALISYCCFKKMFQSRYIGLICSGLYTMSVFRIYKLMITAAVGEGSAVTFMPLVLYGLYRAFSENVKDKEYRTVWIPIAIGYAGLMQTHVLSCEITAFLTIAICIVFIRKIFIKETFLQLAKGALAAAAVSAWYLVPFLDYYMNEDTHIRHVSKRTIQDRGIYPAQLLFSWWKNGENAISGDYGMVRSHAMGIGLILGIGLFVFLILWISGEWKKEKNRIVGLGKTAGVFGAVLMFMSLNIFPWDRIQRLNSVAASLVSSLQFPNRFLGWGTTFCVVIWGCLLWYYKRMGNKWPYYVSVICIVIGLVTSNVYLLDHMVKATNYIYLYNEEGMGNGYISGGEYVVEGTDAEILDYSDPVASEGVEIHQFAKGALSMVMTVQNEFDSEGYVELPLLHYTGYKAYGIKTGEELSTLKGNNNVVRVVVPAGFYDEIDVKFVSPIHWRISEVISYIWWLYVVTLCAGKLIVKRKEKREAVCVIS